MGLRKVAVDITGLTYAYHLRSRDVKIFDGLKLKIHEGEIISILGPSGCGKTTFAGLLAGYLTPSGGTIRFRGQAHKNPGSHCIVINQATDIFEWMTVSENMSLVCKDTERVKHYIKLVGLHDAAEMRGHTLSGGMKKRLSFARALSVNPTFLILDEAFSSLDHALRNKLYEEVLSIIRSEKKTALLITHDIEEAIYLSDRVLVFSSKPSMIVKDVDVRKLRLAGNGTFHRSTAFYALMEELQGVLASQT